MTDNRPPTSLFSGNKDDEQEEQHEIIITDGTSTTEFNQFVHLYKTRSKIDIQRLNYITKNHWTKLTGELSHSFGRKILENFMNTLMRTFPEENSNFTHNSTILSRLFGKQRKYFIVPPLLDPEIEVEYHS